MNIGILQAQDITTSDYMNHIIQYDNQVTTDLLPNQPAMNILTTATCGQDTLQYSRAKGDLTDGVLNGLGLSGPFTAAGQRFEVPTGSTVEVSGFTLFASATGGVISTRCAIYETDPATGLPTGAALTFVDVMVETTDSISYINFNTPVTLTQDFVITAENLSLNLLSLKTNNGNMAAGQGEQLALLLFQGNWVVAETVGPPGAFNFDFIMEPFVNYDITAGVTSDVIANTVYVDSLYNFTSDHSPLLDSRFFNKIAFDQFFSSTTTSPTNWDFGDASPVENGEMLSHVFPAGADTYTVTTTATMEGYTTSCEDVIENTLTTFIPTSYTCGQDTLQYGRAKADLTDGVLNGLGLSGPFTAAGQRFEVPTGSTVEVSGFTLFASATGGVISTRCAIYETDPATGLPTGAALTFVDVMVETTDSISYINFNTPVTLTQDFVITAENLSLNLLSLKTNNGNMAAGQGEQLALLLFQGNWVVAETVGPPGAFNFDFIMEPFVNYDITAGVTSDVIANTVYVDSLYNFTSDHSPLLDSRFFNKIAFDQFFSSTTTSPTNWDFGDASPVENGEMLSHVFPAGAATYTVTTTATMEGFTTSCEDVIENTLTTYVPTSYSCGQDTLQYGRAKADLVIGQLFGLGLSGPFTAAGQRFEVPTGASVEVSGFTLFTQPINGDTSSVRCAIYEADLASGLPTGVALAMVELNLTTEVTSINFDFPVTLTQDFVITTENLSASPLIMTTNSGMAGAGQGEQLALLLFQGDWVVAEIIGPPGGAFNLDFIMEPFVNYDITAGVSSDVIDNTVFVDSIYNFTSDHSPLVGSRFFNTIAFNEFFGTSITSPTDWDFGDGSSVDNGEMLTHTFPAGAATYTVTTTATIQGYTTSCEDIIETSYDVEVINSTIDNLLKSSISIYPNPTNGYSQLSFELENAKKVNVSVYNLLGMQVATYSLGEINNTSLELDLSNQSSGIYLLAIEIDGHSIIEKLVVD